jgi:hypothetical protein
MVNDRFLSGALQSIDHGEHAWNGKSTYAAASEAIRSNSTPLGADSFKLSENLMLICVE